MNKRVNSLSEETPVVENRAGAEEGGTGTDLQTSRPQVEKGGRKPGWRHPRLL